MYKFKYHKPTSLEESINLFKEKEFPKYLSGGMTPYTLDEAIIIFSNRPH